MRARGDAYASKAPLQNPELDRRMSQVLKGIDTKLTSACLVPATALLLSVGAIFVDQYRAG